MVIPVRTLLVVVKGLKLEVTLRRKESYDVKLRGRCW